MRRKVLINAPECYGIEEAIREAFETIGLDGILLTYGTKPTIQEKIARKMGLKIPSLKRFLNPLLKCYLEKEN